MPSGGVFSIKWMFFLWLLCSSITGKKCVKFLICVQLLTQDSWFRFLYCCRQSCEKTVCMCHFISYFRLWMKNIYHSGHVLNLQKKNPVLRGVLTRLRLWLGHYGVKSGNPSQGCLPETICELIHKIDNREQGPQTLDPWKTKQRKEKKKVIYRVSFLPHWNEWMFVESLSVLWPTMPFAIC